MHVTVHQSWNNAAAVEIDARRPRPSRFQHIGARAHGEETIALNSDGLGRGMPRPHGYDFSVVIDCIRRLLRLSREAQQHRR